MVILYFVTTIIIIINIIILAKTFDYGYVIANNRYNLGTRNKNNS